MRSSFGSYKMHNCQHFFASFGAASRADIRCIVLRLHAAAGDTDSERVLAVRSGTRSLSTYAPTSVTEHTVYPIRQTHNIVLRFAPLRNAAARTPRTGQPQFVLLRSPAFALAVACIIEYWLLEPLQRLCYNVRDAVDWFSRPTAKTVRKTQPHSLYSIVNQLGITWFM